MVWSARWRWTQSHANPAPCQNIFPANRENNREFRVFCRFELRLIPRKPAPRANLQPSHPILGANRNRELSGNVSGNYQGPTGERTGNRKNGTISKPESEKPVVQSSVSELNAIKPAKSSFCGAQGQRGKALAHASFHRPRSRFDGTSG